MKKTKLRIIHETNPQKYFPVLYELAKTGQVELTGSHRYSVCKEWLRAWLRDRTSFKQRNQNALKDFLFRLRIPFVKNETIVLGFAPWDWRLLIYRHLAKHNKIVYHTSWHDWRLDKTPRQPKLNGVKSYMQKQWHRFVNHPNVRVVAVTPVVAKTVQQETGVIATVIPHAVPDVFFTAGKNRNHRPNGTLKLLYVGEISEKKGIKVLIELMTQLTDKDVNLTVVGNGPLANLVENGPTNIHYLGPIFDREKLAKIMAQHDVLMLLSQKTKNWEELFGIVIVEAIAAGCAVIASDHIGPREIFNKKTNTGLYNQSAHSEVYAALNNMQQDRTKIQELREAQNVASQFSMLTLKTMWQKAIEQP
ncbi:glycosyltransferase family 4 protein [Paraglaciecola aquimarina]|uniref:Glycosyltransferase family 4 protein n=1 Tax=Paraglaciecola algarum TaxID=3050085 RepID=A0ABS9DC18_9ALTE|nr:glycosyltransferase family 4 protein [Paraglaciecola sp. G1-23]MCF2949892.1 glycosyltransferase family 4 protein [Paraglaciecola sp. G1-23]